MSFFRFQAPYNSRGIRLTTSANAPRGCQPRLYPYWPPINNHRGQGHLYVALGRIGASPILITVGKASGEIISTDDLPIPGTGEGIYFSDTIPTRLYFLDGPRLNQCDVYDGAITTVFALDPQHGDDLWQAHSSADGTVHSATVRRRVADGAYPKVGCVVFRNGRQRFFGVGDHDECQIDKSGRYLIVQKADNDYIFDLDLDTLWVITNEQGAAAHLDAGDGLIAGEDDQHEAGALVVWDLTRPHSDRRLLHATGGPSLGHSAVRGGRVILSSDFTDEILDVSLADGSLRAVAPSLIAHPPVTASEEEKYDHQLRACPDPIGEWCVWVTNFGTLGDPMHAIMAQIGGPTVPPDPQKPPPTGGSMQPLAISTDATFKQVKLRYDNGYEAEGAPDTFDGRPAHLVPLSDSQPAGHGAELTLVWDDGVTQTQHGRLYWNRQPPEFSPDIFTKPTGF